MTDDAAGLRLTADQAGYDPPQGKSTPETTVSQVQLRRVATVIAGYSPTGRAQPVSAIPMGEMMSTALEVVATAADDIAADQRRVARRARAMQRQRDRGWSWAKVLDREAEPALLVLLRSSARRLAESAGQLAQALARGLAGEGESRRQIARRLGVTHQRISAMLHQDRRSAQRQDTPSDR